MVKGFANNEHEEKENINRISLESFQKYGFMPEFMGRLPVRIGMQALTAEELIDVLTVPPDSILNEYQRLLSIDDISLSVDRDALARIANYVETRKMGARALRTVMEEILEDIMFKAPELKGKAVRLTKSLVQKKIEILSSR
jgi:ATP-dependent Clp protease ATP-binding subunit ClpX